MGENWIPLQCDRKSNKKKKKILKKSEEKPTSKMK